MKSYPMIFILLGIYSSNCLFAQYCDHSSYFMESNSNVSPNKTYRYLDQVPDEKGVLNNYRINVRKPIDALNSTVPLRPHIMGVHGFMIGFEKILAYSYGKRLGKQFTQYGYGTSSIEFRSQVKGFAFDLCKEEIMEEGAKTFYRSISDTRSAINYLYDHAEELGIDTTNFFVYGNSLGGTSVMHAVLVEDEQEWLEEFPQFADIILKDPNLKPWPPRREVKGIVSVAGALFSLSFLKEEPAIPMLLGHGVCDELSPFNVGPAFDCDLSPNIYGSYAIAEKATQLGIPYSLHSIQNLGHSWSESIVDGAYPLIRDWLKNQILCGIPQQECFEYINTDTNNQYYKDCPHVDVCLSATSTGKLPVSVETIKVIAAPNPGTNHIQLQGNFEQLNLEIYTAQGQKVLSQNGIVGETRIKTAELPAGLYYLRIYAKGTYNYEVIRWVKQ